MTIWGLLEQCIRQLDEPFRRSEIIGWFRRQMLPDGALSPRDRPCWYALTEASIGARIRLTVGPKLIKLGRDGSPSVRRQAAAMARWRLSLSDV